MTATWTAEELERIGAAEELQMAPLGADGVPRRPVPIWVIRGRRPLRPLIGSADGVIDVIDGLDEDDVPLDVTRAARSQPPAVPRCQAMDQRDAIKVLRPP